MILFLNMVCLTVAFACSAAFLNAARYFKAFFATNRFDVRKILLWQEM
jgi:hypothetical protein